MKSMTEITNGHSPTDASAARPKWAGFVQETKKTYAANVVLTGWIQFMPHVIIVPLNKGPFDIAHVICMHDDCCSRILKIFSLSQEQMHIYDIKIINCSRILKIFFFSQEQMHIYDIKIINIYYELLFFLRIRWSPTKWGRCHRNGAGSSRSVQVEKSKHSSNNIFYNKQNNCYIMCLCCVF